LPFSRIAGRKGVRFAVDMARRVSVLLYHRFYGWPFNRRSIRPAGCMTLCKARKRGIFAHSHAALIAPTAICSTDSRCLWIEEGEGVGGREGEIGSSVRRALG